MAKTYFCVNCGKEKKWCSSSSNKYCSNECFHKHKWNTIIKPRVEAGGDCDPGTRKKYLVETRGEICECCGLGPEYNGFPLVLQLDHIDGNSDNNTVTNLRLLCPNCHSQTNTYGSKGRGYRYHKKKTKRNSYLQKYKS